MPPFGGGAIGPQFFPITKITELDDCLYTIFKTKQILRGYVVIKGYTAANVKRQNIDRKLFDLCSIYLLSFALSQKIILKYFFS